MVAKAGTIRAGRAFVELFADDSKLVRGLKRAQQKLRAFGAGVRSMGARLLAVGTAAAAPLALTSRVFASFESQMARVQALTGATTDEFARLREEAKRLGRSTVFSASQAAEAMSFFALAGFKVDQILRAVGPTLDLAAAGQIDIAQAADIAAKIMAGMGLSADELGGAVDVMAKAMTTANTDLLMLGDAFKFVGPVAKSAGIRLEEITAAIQLLSNAGIQGEMAGTTLRGMLLSLTSPSAEAAKELERLGVRVSDDAGNVQTLADILADLARALSRVGTGQRLQSLGTIFPARQAAGAAELVAQGAERLREATAALESPAGTASRIAATQLDTLRGDVTILLSALEGLAIEIGEALGPTLRRWANGLQAAANFVANLVKNNRELVVGIGKTVAIVIGFGAALVTLGFVIQGIAFGLGGLATAATALAAALGLVGTLLGALLSPIGLVIAAVAALATWLVTSTGVGAQALGWLGERFRVLRDTALEAFQGVSDALAAGDISLAAKILWLTLKVEWKKGVHALNQIWVKVKEFFLSVWTEAVFGAAQIATNAWAGLQTAWAETVDFLLDAWTIFTTGLTKAWNTAIGFIRKAWTRLKSLFDSDVDADAEVARINEEIAGRNRAAQEEQDRRILERDQRRRERLSEIEGQRTGTLAELEREREAEHARRREQFASDLQNSEAALAQARREWQQAIEQAARRREEAEPDEAPGPLGKPDDVVKKLQDELAGLGERLEGRLSVTGTFSAAAVRGLAGAGPAERTAKATEETAKNTKRLLQEAQHGGLVFS